MTGLREIISSNVEETLNGKVDFSVVPFYGGFGSQQKGVQLLKLLSKSKQNFIAFNLFD